MKLIQNFKMPFIQHSIKGIIGFLNIIQRMVDMQVNVKDSIVNVNFLNSDGVNKSCITCKTNITDSCYEQKHIVKYSSKGWSLHYDVLTQKTYATGNVPVEAFDTRYLQGKLIFDSDLSKRKMQNIWRELKKREKYPDVVGVWSVSNNTSINVYHVNENQEQMLIGINNNTPEWRDIVYNENLEPVIRIGRMEWLLSECIKTQNGWL